MIWLDDGDDDGQEQAADDARVRREERVEEDVPVVLVGRGAPAARAGRHDDDDEKQPAERITLGGLSGSRMTSATRLLTRLSGRRAKAPPAECSRRRP